MNFPFIFIHIWVWLDDSYGKINNTSWIKLTDEFLCFWFDEDTLLCRFGKKKIEAPRNQNNKTFKNRFPLAQFNYNKIKVSTWYSDTILIIGKLLQANIAILISPAGISGFKTKPIMNDFRDF